MTLRALISDNVRADSNVRDQVSRALLSRDDLELDSVLEYCAANVNRRQVKIILDDLVARGHVRKVPLSLTRFVYRLTDRGRMSTQILSSARTRLRALAMRRVPTRPRALGSALIPIQTLRTLVDCVRCSSVDLNDEQRAALAAAVEAAWSIPVAVETTL